MKRRIPISEQPRRSKYGVRQDSLGKLGRTVDGIVFDSQKEANRYCELKQLKKAGEIRNLAVHVNYSLKVHEAVVGIYEADFVYESLGKQIVIEDVKGFRTQVYKMKKSLMKAIYGIEIKEI